MTLTELKTLIQSYLENEETTFVSTLNDFIVNAEDRIFELIQFDYFRKNVTGNLTTGNTYLTAPSDFLTSFSLAIIDSNNDLYKPVSLTSTTSGTWISENARNALLYGSLVEAYTFMKGDADLMQLYEQRFNLEVLRLKNQAEARGRKDEYRYDSLRTSVS